MSKNNTTQLTKAEKRELAIGKYFEAQVAMFEEVNERAKKAGREPPFRDANAAATYNIIVRKDDGNFAIRKRAQPFSLADFDLDGKHTGGFANQSFSQKMMGNDAMTSDEVKLLLMGNMECGLEIGEVQSAGSVCL